MLHGEVEANPMNEKMLFVRALATSVVDGGFDFPQMILFTLRWKLEQKNAPMKNTTNYTAESRKGKRSKTMK
jgi:hypothetical protein